MISKKKKQWLIAAVISGVALGSFMESAYAEEFDEEEETSEIVVSATRTEMEVKEAPSTITVINRREIENKEANNVLDVLRDVPGIQLNKSGSVAHGSPLRIRGSESDHILILIDGKKITSDPSFMNSRELERIRLDDVERIEVLKGPSSALYGSSAMGGVINIITRAPSKDTVEVSISHKSLEGDGELQTNLGVYTQGKKRGSFAWTFSAGRNYVNDLSFAKAQQEYPGGEEIPVNFKGIWDLNKNNKLQFDLRYVKEALTHEFYVKNPVNKRAEKYYKHDIERLEYGLDYTGKNAKSNWQIRLYRTKWEKDQDQYKIGTRDWTNFNITKNIAYVAEGKFTHALTDKHLVTTGFDYTWEKIYSTSLGKGADSEEIIYRNGKSIKLGEKDRNNYAFYLQDEWMPHKKWLVIPAIRLEKIDGFEMKATPRIGATFFARPDLRIKANLATGYRVPTMLEMYRESVTGTMKGNPNLTPESSFSKEISIEKDWKKHTAKLTYFHNDVKDLIVSEKVGTIWTWNNKEEALLQGIEFTTTHTLSKEFKLNTGYTYLDAKDTEKDERLLGRSRHQFTLGASYQPLKSKWSFSVDGVLKTDYLHKDEFEKVHDTSYFIFNTMMKRSLGKDDKATIYVGIENLFDRQEHELSEYGRTYVFGAKYKF